MIGLTAAAPAQGMLRLVFGAVVVMFLGVSQGAEAQGLVQGVQQGAEAGNKAAGPVGGVLGGAIGGVVGVFTGALGVGGKDTQAPAASATKQAGSTKNAKAAKGTPPPIALPKILRSGVKPN